MILDTNALSAAAESDPGIVAQIARADQVFLTVISLGEYRYGISRSRHHTRYEKWLSAFIDDTTVLSIENETTIYYAAISLELRRAGSPIPANDLWIAALCLQHSLPLISRDRHFDHVSGVTRISW